MKGRKNKFKIINNKNMAKDNVNNEKRDKVKRARIIKPPLNDRTNTPVPDSSSVVVPSKSEAALYRQAENPLGDPHKI
jgi:hypothetical protein